METIDLDISNYESVAYKVDHFVHQKLSSAIHDRHAKT
jgi:hypothetical protein